jgi:deoxyribonuclease IV
MIMIKFGPAGNSASFYAEGYKSTWQTPAWLKNRGLNAFEYPFGRGVQISADAALRIGRESAAYGIYVSAHAPYYINLANPDTAIRGNSFRYILDSAKAVTDMGGDRVVVHVGAALKLDRADANMFCADGLKEAMLRLDDAGLGKVHICPETMGKRSQIGDLDETLAFCSLDARLVPCVDFAHLHALTQGGLRETGDFSLVLDKLESALGIDRARGMHIHFSTIEFTPAGEKRHRTFAEEAYGPRFELLAPLLKSRGYTSTVICESKETMAEDATAMRDIFTALGI